MSERKTESATRLIEAIKLLDNAKMRVGSFGNMNIEVVRRDEAEAILRSAQSPAIVFDEADKKVVDDIGKKPMDALTTMDKFALLGLASRATSAPSQSERICVTTGNPCGTDTVAVGQDCPGGGACKFAPSALVKEESAVSSTAEPVAWMMVSSGGVSFKAHRPGDEHNWTPLYASPVSAIRPTLPDMEAVSAAVHAAWIASKLAQDVTSRKAEDGEELMVPYSQLSEKAKELDRGTVKAVYAAIEAARS